ncbi:MAG: prepilin-type N-terminal cleavage/methylation domain-containing protein [Burkholderiaceae bacterium]|nr:prepilin-type N-terminal cleavage/methylation domain-containing protein [Burkholderiaceae bacterium]
MALEIIPHPRHVAGPRGFTMVELVTVIVIMGIMAAVAAPRFFERQTFDARTFTDQTRTMLRLAQKVAIAQNRPVHVRLDGQSVALCFDAACTALVFPPGGSNSGSAVTVAKCGGVSAWSCEGVPSGLAYTLTAGAGSTFYFDPIGKPYAAGDAWPSLASSFQQLVVRITGDGVNHDVTVETETGYVH